MKHVELNIDVTYTVTVQTDITEDTYLELYEICRTRNGQIESYIRDYPKATDFLFSEVDDENATELSYRIRDIRDVDDD